MAVVRLGLIGASIRRGQAGQNSRRYGQTRHLPLRRGAYPRTQALGLLRAALPADMATDSVIMSATLRFYQQRPNEWGRNIWVTMNNRSFRPGTVTWSTAPPQDQSTQVDTWVTAGPARRWWELDVTGHVQQWVSGARPNYGWRLGIDETNAAGWGLVVRGATAHVNPAELVIEWFAPGDPPTDLVPDSQAVSIAAPTLRFLPAPDAEATQVQVHTSANFTDPLFDSGEVVGPEGELDLSTTDFPGLELSGTVEVPNPSFEEGTTGWTGVNASVATVADPVRAGSSALEVTCTNGTYATQAATAGTGTGGVPVEPDTTYRVDGYARAATDSRSAEWRFQAYDAVGADVPDPATSAPTVDTTDGWTRISHTFTTGPQTHFLRLQLAWTGAPSGEVHYLDTVTLTRDDAGESTYYWRARSQDAGGDWSDWSDVATLTRRAKGQIAITSPQETADDSTPPVLWTFDGVQEAWQVIFRDADGRVVANSGRTGGDAAEWTPTRAVAVEGERAEIEVRVWDDEDRVATPGDPLWASTRQTYTLTGSDEVAGPGTLTATTPPLEPGIALHATRETAPDGWAVVRDGVRIHRVDEPLTELTYTDWTATPGEEHLYRLAPIVNGKVSAQEPFARVESRVSGVWLVDPDTGERAVVWGQEDPEFSAAEIAVVHQPIAGPPVRRVAYRPPFSGAMSGDLLDRDDYSLGIHLAARESERVLWRFKDRDAGEPLRLITPTWNLAVTVGDITVAPVPAEDGSSHHRRASFSWWALDDMPWSP